MRYHFAAICALLASSAHSQFTYNIDEKNSYYLRCDVSFSSSCTRINLASLGILPGDILKLQQLGDIAVGNTGSLAMDIYAKPLLGVFNSSGALVSDTSQLHRVTGAIDAGSDFFII